MKFPQVPIGQRLLFQGEGYVKVGPLTARRERDGETRLIPRSALVELPRAGAGGASVGPGVVPDRVSRALVAYEEVLWSALLSSDGDSDARLRERLDQAMTEARRAFEESLAVTGGLTEGT